MLIPSRRPWLLFSYSEIADLLVECAIQERHDLGSRAGVAGAEQTAADTAGNAVLLRPGDRRRIVSVSCHIVEGRIAAHGRTAVGTPHEGNDLCAGAGSVRARRLCHSCPW